MRTHFRAHNLWSFVEKRLAKGADDTARRRNHLALSQIHQGVDFQFSEKL